MPRLGSLWGWAVEVWLCSRSQPQSFPVVSGGSRPGYGLGKVSLDFQGFLRVFASNIVHFWPCARIVSKAYVSRIYSYSPGTHLIKTTLLFCTARDSIPRRRVWAYLGFLLNPMEQGLVEKGFAPGPPQKWKCKSCTGSLWRYYPDCVSRNDAGLMVFSLGFPPYLLPGSSSSTWDSRLSSPSIGCQSQ